MITGKPQKSSFLSDLATFVLSDHNFFLVARHLPSPLLVAGPVKKNTFLLLPLNSLILHMIVDDKYPQNLRKYRLFQIAGKKFPLNSFKGEKTFSFFLSRHRHGNPSPLCTPEEITPTPISTLGHSKYILHEKKVSLMRD